MHGIKTIHKQCIYWGVFTTTAMNHDYVTSNVLLSLSFPQKYDVPHCSQCGKFSCNKCLVGFI